MASDHAACLPGGSCGAQVHYVGISDLSVSHLTLLTLIDHHFEDTRQFLAERVEAHQL